MKGRTLSLVLLLIGPGVAQAQSLADYDYANLQFRGIGVDFGGVAPGEVEPAVSVGVRADLGLVGPHVRVMPSVSFWSSSLRRSEVDRLASQIIRVCEKQVAAVCPSSLDLGRIRRSDLALAADAHYLFDGLAPFLPYAGAGMSLHLLNGRGELIDGTFVEDLLDTIVPGLDAVAGVEVPLGVGLHLGLETRFVVSSDVSYAGVGLGGRWTLPVPGLAARLRR